MLCWWMLGAIDAQLPQISKRSCLEKEMDWSTWKACRMASDGLRQGMLLPFRPGPGQKVWLYVEFDCWNAPCQENQCTSATMQVKCKMNQYAFKMTTPMLFLTQRYWNGEMMFSRCNWTIPRQVGYIPWTWEALAPVYVVCAGKLKK